MTDLTALRELHAPSGDTYLRCEGCDSSGWEAEAPDWPCRTALLVYSDEEIEAFRESEKRAIQALWEENKRYRERRMRERADGSPATMGEQIADIYAPMVRDALSAPIIFRNTES